jgi:hypothetical protein
MTQLVEFSVVIHNYSFGEKRIYFNILYNVIMKFNLFLLLLLVSCLSQNQSPFWKTNLNFSELSSYSVSKSDGTGGLSLIIDNGVAENMKPQRFRYTKQEKEQLISLIMNLSIEKKPKKTFSLEKISPHVIGMRAGKQVVGMEIFEGDESCYAINRVQLANNGYISKDDCNKLLYPDTFLANSDVELGDFHKVKYIKKDKTRELSTSEIEILKQELENKPISRIVFRGEVDISIQKKFKLGQYKNENFKGYFKYKTNEENKRLMFSRPNITGNLAYIWIEGTGSIYEIKDVNWKKIKVIDDNEQ